MTPNPTLKVLSIFQKHRVKALLIGGQACIVYGAAEFSRDSDFVVLVTPENLRCLRKALAELEAEQIFFPSLKAVHLRRGHGCHFRCQAAGVEGFRVDLLAKLRGCDDFAALWKRKLAVELPDGLQIQIIDVRDLVRCKKTQRDKDWEMLRRLVENDIHKHRQEPKKGQIEWWLMECRTPSTLISLAQQFEKVTNRLLKARPLLAHAIRQEEKAIYTGLAEEEQFERELDREYWKPLRTELEKMRLARPRRN